MEKTVNYKVTVIYYTNLNGRALQVENYSIDATDIFSAIGVASIRAHDELLDGARDVHTLGVVEVHAVKARV